MSDDGKIIDLEARRKQHPVQMSEDEWHVMSLSMSYFMTALPAIGMDFGKAFEQASEGLGERAAEHKAALIGYMQATTQDTKKERAAGFDRLVWRMLRAKQTQLGSHHT